MLINIIIVTYSIYCIPNWNAICSLYKWKLAILTCQLVTNSDSLICGLWQQGWWRWWLWDEGGAPDIQTPGSWPCGSLQTSVAAAHSLTLSSDQSALWNNERPAPRGHAHPTLIYMRFCMEYSDLWSLSLCTSDMEEEYEERREWWCANDMEEEDHIRSDSLLHPGGSAAAANLTDTPFWPTSLQPQSAVFLLVYFGTSA